MGFPKGASIPFGRERGSNPARDFNLISLFERLPNKVEYYANRMQADGRVALTVSASYPITEL